MNTKSKKILKRVVALFLVMAMFFLLPANGMTGQMAQAASSKKKYISELKLYVSTGDQDKGVQAWCDTQPENQDENQENDWHYVEGDLNAGADGALKSAADVYLCYRTTTDVKKAVRDMAVMNESGNYSADDYKIFLQQQQEVYTDMVNDMKTMLGEYRTNYKNGVKSAVMAHDFMNGYIEDDSGRLLGDLLLEISDSDLVNVLFQANGQVVLMIQEQLALACDTKNSTWLDRMQKLGSYDKLRAQFLKAYNNNAARADKELQAKYHSKALQLLECWDDIRLHMDNVKEFEKKYGFDSLSQEEIEAWWEESSEEFEKMQYEQELNTLLILYAYEYDGGTLRDYFSQDIDKVRGGNIKYLYPLAASLTDGQIAALDGSVSMYQLIQNAAIQSVFDDGQTGMGKKIQEGMNSTETDDAKKDDTGEEKQIIEDTYQSIKERDPVSVYEDVDRDVFKDGVAITSTAQNYSNAYEKPWSDAFVERGKFGWTAGSLAVGTILSGVGALLFRNGMGNLVEDIGMKMFDYAAGDLKTAVGVYRLKPKTCYMCQTTTWENLKMGLDLGNHNSKAACQDAVSDLLEKGFARDNNEFKFQLFRGFKIGLTVFAIALAVADIVMTVITLKNYYNRDHLPIPHHLVDISYHEEKETSYVSYKSVPDQQGNYGDLNGNSGKQWLALYATTDEDAGNPILAPDGEEHRIIVQYKDSKEPDGYSPLHFFGKPNVAQNLTYSDSKDGWSFNDKKKGTYLFFERDANATSSGAEAERWSATAMTGGNTVLVAGIGALGGLVIGIFGMVLIGRRRKKTE